ncbi:hypothetical protein W7K_00085 [Stenotrophomonas geniculata N1]|uniref:Uncharacterized protein n=1 Tax=Stenotrophomonas geniculata N1 TaxID=1167641 RepID=A0A0L8AGD9_9GAMM|nr:hypothetical protein W7K_00085 [Stenotrophomonas geniculata N1]
MTLHALSRGGSSPSAAVAPAVQAMLRQRRCNSLRTTPVAYRRTDRAAREQPRTGSPSRRPCGG